MNNTNRHKCKSTMQNKSSTIFTIYEVDAAPSSECNNSNANLLTAEFNILCFNLLFLFFLSFAPFLLLYVALHCIILCCTA